MFREQERLIFLHILLSSLSVPDMLGRESSYSILCIFLGFLLLRVIMSEIELGSRISVVENNSWVSSNGDFAVRFFNRSNKHSVGIHFNSKSIPLGKQTVVWVAGADLKVGDGSYFELNRNGDLVLFDSALGTIAWTSKTANSSVTSAILHDNGNLVLMNKHKDIAWQSFDTPSDTLLPGQNLSSSQTLRAARRNSVSSYYSLSLADLGQLQLKWESNVIYWTSKSQSQSILRASLSSEGALQLLDERSKPVWSVFGEDHNESDLKYRILRLDVDGNLRLYSWMEASSSWKPVWQAVENQCNVFATCGLYGICIYNSSGSPVCKCPFTLTSDSNSECLVPYRQNCNSGSSMLTYEHTFLYGLYPPNETILHASLQQCKSLCQKDPLCTTATFTNDGSGQCRVTQTQYISGLSGPSVTSISFAKSCSDPRAVFPIIPNSPPSSIQYSHRKKSDKLCIPCLIGVATVMFVTFFIFQLGICLCFLSRRKSFRPKTASAYSGLLSKSFTMLSYPEIKDLTENFKYRLGPKMFKGMFPNDKPVVVKALNATICERKFRNAASKLGSIHHKNLVKLEGFCCESSHRYLVYEFSKNFSVGKCLEDPKLCSGLSWRTRMKICITVARTISYLHAGCREFVSHGSINCDNVVLDDNFEAKLAEYGLWCFEESSNGGCGETDIIDFGKMVIAVVSGVENDAYIEWAYKCWLGSHSDEVVDKRIEGEVDMNELERLLRLAFWCLQVDERLRPSMVEVVNVLEGVLHIDSPPHPFARRSPPDEEELSESCPEP